MAWTVSELDAIIVQLERALATGTRSVTFPDRSVVEYATPTELFEALSYFKALKAATEATAAGTPTRPKRLILCSTSGVC